MGNDPRDTTSGAGTSSFEDAVRGALQRRPEARPSNRPVGTAGGPTKLRRWSVAELIARATPRPPAGGASH